MGKASRVRQQAERKALQKEVREHLTAIERPVRATVEDPVEIPVPSTGLPDGWRELVVRLEVRQAADRRRQTEVVMQALMAGVTYSEVARLLGVSRQGAYHRYRRLRPVLARPGAEPAATAAAGTGDANPSPRYAGVDNLQGWDEQPLFQ